MNRKTAQQKEGKTAFLMTLMVSQWTKDKQVLLDRGVLTDKETVTNMNFQIQVLCLCAVGLFLDFYIPIQGNSK